MIAPSITPTVYKIVMLGESGVGKTSIVLQLNDHVFNQMTVPTVALEPIPKQFRQTMVILPLTFGIQLVKKDIVHLPGSTVKMQVPH